MDCIRGQILDPRRCDIDQLEFIGETFDRATVKGRRNGLSGEASCAEQRIARKIRALSEQRGMDLYPNLSLGMKQRQTVVRIAAQVVAVVLHVPATHKSCLDRCAALLGDQDVYIAHRSEVPNWVMLFADRDTFQQS